MKKIGLVGQRGTDLFALVDVEDFEKLSQFRWYYNSKGGYAQRWFMLDGKVKWVKMHHEVLPRREGFDVDHRDRNGLNNQRSNLRYVSHRENLTNNVQKRPSPLGRNVYLQANNKGYFVRCKYFGKWVYGGSFQDLGDAQRAARELRERLGYLRV